MNFPLRTAFAMSHWFWVVVSSFSFFSRKFQVCSLISFLTHSLFNSMLFSLQDFECFGIFPLGLVSTFIPLWSEKMLDMISIFLNLLRLVLCRNTRFIFSKNQLLDSLILRIVILVSMSFSSALILVISFLLLALACLCCCSSSSCRCRVRLFV